MRKKGILNSEIAAVIGLMGHGDTLCIADAGLPIPEGVKRIDLAVISGVPDFLTVLDAVLEELQIENAVIADEMRSASPQLFEKVSDRMAASQCTSIPHEQIKEALKKTRCVIRTGECTPYANIILISGVTF